MSTNFLARINGQLVDLGNIILNQTSQSITLSTNDTINQQYSMTFKGQIAIKTNDIKVAMNGYCLKGTQQYTFGPARQRLYVGCGSVANADIGNTLAFSTNTYTWTGLGSTVFNSSANSVCYNGKMWVAAGEDSTNSLAFSWDGKLWNGLGPILSPGYAVAWNGILFVAGGTAGDRGSTLVYSYDGINWIAATVSISSSVTAIGWNGAMWEAGSSDGKMAYSYDGITWTLSTNVSALAGNRVNDIKWVGSMWYVAMNSNNSLIVYSVDGLTWINNSLSGYFSMKFNQFVWNGNIMMACGEGGTYTYAYSGSPLSKFWGQTLTPMTSAKSIKWTGKTFLMFGSGTDQIETITYPTSSPYHAQPSYLTVRTPAFTNGTNFDFSILNPHTVTFPAYMVIAGGQAGSHTMAYSYDGIAWTGLGTTVFTSACNSVQYNGTLWVAGGASSGGNTLAFSYNGITWTGLGNSMFSSTCMSVVWSGTIWAAVGNTGGKATGGIAYSYDGLTWVPVVSNSFSSAIGGKSIAYNGKIFVAAGGGIVAGNSILYSSNGIQWTPSGQAAFSDITTQGVNGVCWNGSKWVAVGNGGNSIAYSYDGSNWIGLGVSTFSTYGNEVAWNGKLFVATGGSGNCAATSYDGITWSGLGKTPFITAGLAIGWDGTRWQMGNVSASSAAYSYDGRRWTPYTNSFNSTICFGTNYNVRPIPYIQQPSIAVGQGAYQIAYSDDGITWKGVGQNIFAGQANAVAWNGQIWVAVGMSNGFGNNHSIAYSVDGINWTGLGGSIFSGGANGIAWNGLLWVATGNDPVNTIAYSYNGIQWFGLGNSVFNVQGFGVAYNGTSWVAMGQGENTIAYSYNGIQWFGLGNTVFTFAGTNIATNGTYWIATGSGGTSLAYTTSQDGSTGWTAISSPFAYSGYGIAWNGQIWVATGGDSTNMMAYSYNGLDWTPGNNPMNLFEYRATGVCWNGKRFITGGYGYGQHSIAYSSDGINWYPAYVGTNYNNNTPTGCYTSQIFTQCFSVASNSNLGVPVVQSQMILNPVQNEATTELLISSAPYYQEGFNEISFKVEQNNLY